jgi:hypothetical protein
MKTLLWMNTSILGLCIIVLREDIDIYYIAIPFLLSFIAILLILFSLKDGKQKSFGTPPFDDIENIKEDEWMKFQGLINMSKAHKFAFDHNAKIVETRASKISYATNLLISSVISIFIVVLLYLYQNYERRSQMADNNENNSTKSSSSKPTMSSATTKPEVMLSTNRFTTQDSIHGTFSIENYTQKSESQKKSNNNSLKDK